jgi:hypothetical protein
MCSDPAILAPASGFVPYRSARHQAGHRASGMISLRPKGEVQVGDAVVHVQVYRGSVHRPPTGPARAGRAPGCLGDVGERQVVAAEAQTMTP